MRRAKRMIQYLARRIQYRESNLERTWYEDSAIRTSKLWGIQDEAWSHYEEPNMRKPKNNIFSELYFDQYEVSVNAKNIRYFEVEEHPLIKVNSLLIIIFKIFVASCRVAGVGWLSWTAIESLRAFGERVFANFRDKNVVFTHFCVDSPALALTALR